MENEKFILIKQLYENSIIPTRGSAEAAGYDLYAHLSDDTESIDIYPHTTTLIGTGIAVQCLKNHFGAIFARSGLASKEGLRPANCVGVVDSDYRGEIKVALHNDSEEIRTVMQGERIAQLVIIPYTSVDLAIVDSLDQTERGENGFGSTGTN